VTLGWLVGWFEKWETVGDDEIKGSWGENREGGDEGRGSRGRLERSGFRVGSRC
jgi:hypothetical protein